MSLSSGATSAGSKRGSRYDETFVMKVGPSPQNRELLQVFDIRGSSMSRIFASADFKRFVTVDDAGLAYVLEEIAPAQLK